MKRYKKDIEERLFPVYKMFDVDVKNINDELSIGDLGLDSLDVIEFGLEIEDTFDIIFQTGEITFQSTHKDIVELIESKLS